MLYVLIVAYSYFDSQLLRYNTYKYIIDEKFTQRINMILDLQLNIRAVHVVCMLNRKLFNSAVSLLILVIFC